MNAVDVIYAASPVYLYLNPGILGYLLRPLLEYQETHLYPNLYAARDIGMSFPHIKRLDGLMEGLKGTNYSMAIGNNEVHSEGIERKQISRWSSFFNLRLSNQNAVHYIESGNMLIMAYAHAQRTGDTSLISQHVSSPPSYHRSFYKSVQYNLLKNWTEYLVENSLAPGAQYVPYSAHILIFIGVTYIFVDPHRFRMVFRLWTKQILLWKAS